MTNTRSLDPIADRPPVAPRFLAAQPVWARGRQSEMNCLIGFRCRLPGRPEGATLRLTASTAYRAWLNGEFLAYGPARGPHGHFRVDEIDLADRLAEGENWLALEVVGYNVNSYYWPDQPAFLQAEITAGPDDAPQVLAATGSRQGPFEAAPLPHRLQRVARYSFQRPFSEVYRMGPAADAWRTGGPWSPAQLDVGEPVDRLPRRAPQPAYTLYPPRAHLARAVLHDRPLPPEKLRKDRSFTHISDTLKGFEPDQLEATPSLDVQHLAAEWTADEQPYEGGPLSLTARTARLMDVGVNRTGFLGATVTCTEPTRLWMTFDEILTDGEVDFDRMDTVNLVAWDLEPGTYRLESFEPYTLRYWQLLCVEGACEVSGLFLREYAHPPVAGQFQADDERLNRLFAAGVETYRQNALDLFMDCPSRERAGWLCDSFFTARVEPDLTGASRIEDSFLENYLLPGRFGALPAGMVPMCYPGDHLNGQFIPNWALWLVVQLPEYAARGGDPAVVAAYRSKVAALLDFFERYENADGLLEKLPSWVFVEWSKANSFVQDVNYPSNMLYAGALDVAGQLYDEPAWRDAAKRVRTTVRRQSFDGEFFVDNALREDGRLTVTRNRTEVCQYFAFFFDVASPQSHPELWARLRDEFGPPRRQSGAWPEVHPANSFIGNMLRIELLSRAGLAQQILDESIAYLLYMADRTGTLWEHDAPHASCNHGFASHIVHTLYRDVLGLYAIDRPNRRVTVRLNALQLPACRGTIPTADGELSLEWRVDGRKLRHRLALPEGWTAEIDNRTDRKLAEM